MIDTLRNSENALKQLENLVDDIQKDEKSIDIPDRSELVNEKIHLNQSPNGNVKVNGHWVHPLYARINNMLADGQSPIIIIVGKEGLGKSMTALVMLYYLHDKLNVLRGSFNPERQTVYRVLEFLMLERNTTRTGVMFDEANETLNSNQYHSPMNKAVASALRTQRKRENLHVFVCPEYKKLDSRIREKVDILIDMKGKQFASVKSYRMKHGKRSNRGLDYQFTKYPNWAVPDVKESLKQTYDKVDDQFKGSYLDDLLIKVIREKIEEIEEQQTATL